MQHEHAYYIQIIGLNLRFQIWVSFRSSTRTSIDFISFNWHILKYFTLWKHRTTRKKKSQNLNFKWLILIFELMLFLRYLFGFGHSNIFLWLKIIMKPTCNKNTLTLSVSIIPINLLLSFLQGAYPYIEFFIFWNINSDILYTLFFITFLVINI